MKKLLIFLLFPLVVIGQTPTLNNFNREDFTVDARETPTNVVKINRIFTNVYNTLIVTNLTVVTNLYVTTNSYVIINGATNQQALWQYDGNYLRPAVEELGVQVTNLWSKWILTAYGSFITAPQTEIHLVAGTNNVSTYGKTLILLEGKETNRVVQLQSPMSEGAHLYLMFSTNGGGMTLATQPCYDYPLTQRTIVRNGAWLPTQLAETIHLIGTSAGWVEVSRANPNTNAPGAINPTVGYVPYNQDGILFGDSPWYYRSDSELGFGPGVSNQKRFLLSTNSNLSLGSTSLEQEDDVANRGNTAIGHAAMPKFLLGDDNTALGHVSLYYLTNGGANVAVGKAALYNLTNTSTYFGYNTAVGAWAGQFLSTGESNTFIGSGADAIGGAATNRIAIGQNSYATNDNDVVIGNVNNQAIYVPAQLSLTQGTNTAQVVFGPGTTNVLYRSARNLVYTNGGTQVLFDVVNGSGYKAELGVTTGGQAQLMASPLKNVCLLPDAASGAGLIISTNSVQGQIDNAISFGEDSSNGSFKSMYLKGTNYIQAMNDGAGNRARLEISQPSTNGPVILDSTTAGTAGYSRGFSFRTNGVEIASFTGSGGGGTYVARAGDIMTGALQAPTLTVTNGAAFSIMQPDAANTMGIRNGTSAQKYSVYNTYANSGTDYERGVLDWQGSANTFRIGTEAGGTGSARNISFIVGGLEKMGLTANYITCSKPLLFSSDTILGRGGFAAQIQLGNSVGSSSPANYRISAESGAGTDVAGGALTIEGGYSSGTAAAGKIDISTGLSGEASSSGYTGNAQSIRAHYKAKFVALTHDTATTIETFSLAANKILGGTMTVTCYATNSTPHLQSQTAVVTFDAVAVSTTITGTISSVANPTAADSGTLTCTYSLVDNTDNTFSIKLRANSDLTTPTERAKVVVTALNGNSAFTITDP